MADTSVTIDAASSKASVAIAPASSGTSALTPSAPPAPAPPSTGLTSGSFTATAPAGSDAFKMLPGAHFNIGNGSLHSDVDAPTFTTLEGPDGLAAGAFLYNNGLYGTGMLFDHSNVFLAKSGVTYVRIDDSNLLQFPRGLNSASLATFVAGIGVGNSAAASVAVGPLVKKIEIFDAAGVSLGFIPVYSSIT